MAQESMNIALPESMKEFVLAQVSEGGYSTASEYVRELIRADQKRKAADRLEALLLEGLDSGPATAMAKKDWDAIRAEVSAAQEERSQMTSRVAKRPAAIRDLIDHASYLGARSPQAEACFMEAVEKSFDCLAGMPEIGGVYEAKTPRLSGLRMWAIKGFENYLIFYRGGADGIEIIRVLHGARDIAAILGDD